MEKVVFAARALIRGFAGLGIAGLGLVMSNAGVWRAVDVLGGWGSTVGNLLVAALGVLVVYCGWLVLAGIWRGDRFGFGERHSHRDHRGPYGENAYQGAGGGFGAYGGGGASGTVTVPAAAMVAAPAARKRPPPSGNPEGHENGGAPACRKRDIGA